MKVKMINFCRHTSPFKKDEWVESDDIIEMDDKYIPNTGDFFIYENADGIYKCVGRVLYAGIGIKLYVEKIAEVQL